MGRIVVGFDESEASAAALRWAIEAAELRGDELQVIECWYEPVIQSTAWVDIYEDIERVRRETEVAFAATVDEVDKQHPGVGVVHAFVADRPARALITASEGASMVVVGARGRGGFASLLLGSVSRRVAGSARCPVVVVGTMSAPGGEVLVGVDGSESGRRALAWAAEEAQRRHARLHALMAWSYLLPEGNEGPEPFQPDYTDADARLALSRIAEDVLGDHPDVELKLTSTCSLAAKALVEEGANASLLVVGPKGTSMRHRVDLGSVTAQLLHHAPCPVAVVRTARDD